MGVGVGVALCALRLSADGLVSAPSYRTAPTSSSHRTRGLPRSGTDRARTDVQSVPVSSVNLKLVYSFKNLLTNSLTISKEQNAAEEAPGRVYGDNDQEAREAAGKALLRPGQGVALTRTLTPHPAGGWAGRHVSAVRSEGASRPRRCGGSVACASKFTERKRERAMGHGEKERERGQGCRV